MDSETSKIIFIIILFLPVFVASWVIYVRFSPQKFDEESKHKKLS